MLGLRTLATTSRYLARLEPETDAGWLAAAAAIGVCAHGREGARGVSIFITGFLFGSIMHLIGNVMHDAEMRRRGVPE